MEDVIKVFYFLFFYFSDSQLIKELSHCHKLKFCNPFWGNLCHHFEIIYLLKNADLSMGALKSRGMSVVCRFFFILVLFVLFPTVLCAFV